jgi:hypothetical protein
MGEPHDTGKFTDTHKPSRAATTRYSYLHSVEARIILVSALLDNVQHEGRRRADLARGIHAVSAAAGSRGGREGAAHAGSETEAR